MIADFSEFTYGYALTHELISTSSLSILTAPIFPSLIDEGRVGGYDVAIHFSGYPLFIQFKLSEYMKSKSSKEWTVYNNPYYRFNLRPSSKSKQHELLLSLETKYGNVFYAAPTINEAEEFNKAYFLGNIVRNSVFIRPSVIGRLPDDKEHRVVFQPSSHIGYFCSDPRKIEILTEEKFKSKVLNENIEGGLLKNRNDFIELGQEMLEIIAMKNSDERTKVKEIFLSDLREQPVQTVAYLSRAFFNCEFYLIKGEY